MHVSLPEEGYGRDILTNENAGYIGPVKYI